MILKGRPRPKPGKQGFVATVTKGNRANAARNRRQQQVMKEAQF